MELKSNKRSFGSEGEKIAADYLIENSFEIITKNFRVGRLGEIDIIARESGYICFIEVKTRTSTFFGMPSEAVNRKKRLNISRLASIYLDRRNLSSSNVRFDIVEVLIEKDELKNRKVKINLIRNAF